MFSFCYYELNPTSRSLSPGLPWLKLITTVSKCVPKHNAFSPWLISNLPDYTTVTCQGMISWKDVIRIGNSTGRGTLRDKSARRVICLQMVLDLRYGRKTCQEWFIKKRPIKETICRRCLNLRCVRRMCQISVKHTYIIKYYLRVKSPTPYFKWCFRRSINIKCELVMWDNSLNWKEQSLQ